MAADQDAFRHSGSQSGLHITAPAQQLLSYDELLDARQVAIAVQGRWFDQSATDAELACLWPLKQPVGDRIQSVTQLSKNPTQRKAETAGSAGVLRPQLQKHYSHRTAAKNPDAKHNQKGQRQHSLAQPKTKGAQRSKRFLEEAITSASSLDTKQSGPDSSANDSVHTAHFSDEGELSDAGNEDTSKQHRPKQKSSKKGPVVLYHGPNSEQVAASRAAAKPPPGPRPQLGDVLLEAIHSDAVRLSAKATGVPEEPQTRNTWRCIMRRRLPDGQVTECGRENLWYVQQCVECDAANGATELASRVSAILQTSGTGQISTRQVMNRLTAFSSSPTALMHAFTVEMVQQAMEQWGQAQGRKAYQAPGASASNAQAVNSHLPAGACCAADHKAATGQKAKPNPIVQNGSGLDQPWDNSASALRQALSSLAATQPAPNSHPPASLPASHLSSAAQQATTSAGAHAAELDSQDDRSAGVARGPAGQQGADPGQGLVPDTGRALVPDTGRALVPDSGLHRPSEQGTVRQAFHFAHDLLDVVMRQQPKMFKASKKRGARAQWALVRKPSAYGCTQGQMHRRVFQLPALPKHQPQLDTWLKPTSPDIVVHYPQSTPQAATPLPDTQVLRPNHSTDNHHNPSEDNEGHATLGSMADADEADGAEEEADAAAEEAETQADAADEQYQQIPSTTAQIDSQQVQYTAAVKAAGGGHQAGLAEADEAAEPDTADVASSGMAEEPHYRAEGLRPRPAARALAGPTVHMLQEGYDVYKDSGLKRKGNDFPLREVLHVSQHSRQLWLQQQPFKLRKGMPQDVAKGTHRRGGWLQMHGRKIDTKRYALDRQQEPGPPCNIGGSRHPSAFHPFSFPTGSAASNPVAATTARTSVGSEHRDQAEVGNHSGTHSMDRGPAAAEAQQQQQRQQPVRQANTAQREAIDVAASVPPQQDQAPRQMAGGRPRGRASEHSPDQTRAGPRRTDLGTVAPPAERLELSSESEMLEQFRDMDGDAWKVFCMASKMGLRPEVIERAASRFRKLQEHSQ